MSGTTDVGELIEYARRKGMNAIAITDWQSISAFPEAWRALQEDANNGMKVIYGVEVCLADDISAGEVEQVTGICADLSVYHATILIQNEQGKRNLYRMISEASSSSPKGEIRLLKSTLAADREGLFVGSACKEGELYRALIHGYTEEQLKKIVEFYDYLEVQPVSNNRSLFGENPDICRDENIKELNRKIVELGDYYEKPVVATGDVHYLKSKDVLARMALLDEQGKEFREEAQYELYFKDTEEMLKEFAYLGEEKAYEIVVENTNRIAEQIDKISPLPEKRLPVCEDSAEKLKEYCYEKGRKLYGEILPKEVEERLLTELRAIIDHGYATLYYGMLEIMEKSNLSKHQYAVRSMAASSFIVYLCDLSQGLNPLPPHYRCEDDLYTEFPTAGTVRMGCDLPDKNCPVCGKRLIKDGFGLTYQMFMGANGGKEPKFQVGVTENEKENLLKLFDSFPGISAAIRGGTEALIWEQHDNIAERFAQRSGIQLTEEEKDILEAGVSDVTCGYGKSVCDKYLIPKGSECTAEILPTRVCGKEVVTAFDQMWLSDSFYALQTIGTRMITILDNLVQKTGYSPEKISLEDQEVLSLFRYSDNHMGLGSQGIPLPDREIVEEILRKVKPQSFSELVKIFDIAASDFSWDSYEKEFVRCQHAFQKIITTKDDLYEFLISAGIQPEEAFRTVMMSRRKRTVSKEVEAALGKISCPEKFAESFMKGWYLPVRAQQILFTSIIWKIGYYKIHFPKEFEEICGSPEGED